MPDQDTKYCPRCSMTLSGPGFCPQCGLAVGYGPDQSAPLDEPFPTATHDEEQTHYDLPPVATSYRSPEFQAPPPAAPPTPPVHYEAPPPEPRPARDRSALVLPVIGVACVLALIVGGLWFLTSGDDDKADDAPTRETPAQSDSPDSSTPPDKAGATGPLQIAAPYKNQDCTDQLIVVLASSGDPGSDDRTIGGAAKKVPGAKYLKTSKSCATFNQSLNGNPIYAAYIGPYDSMSDACQARTDTGIASSYVRMLSLDRELREICSCEDEASALPRLSTETAAAPTYDIRLRVFDLQSLLYLAGVNPDNTVTGTFGPETEAMVRAFQRQQDLKRDGWVGPQTWGRLLADACP